VQQVDESTACHVRAIDGRDSFHPARWQAAKHRAAPLTTRARKSQSAGLEQISGATLEGAAELSERFEGRVLPGAF